MPDRPTDHEPTEPERSAEPVSNRPPRFSLKQLQLWSTLFFLSPSSFYRRFARRDSMELATMFAFFAGLQSQLIAPPDTGWLIYHLVTLLFAVITGTLIYLIGGWWYRMRIKWSGHPKPDKRLARRVYLYASQAQSIPHIMVFVLPPLFSTTPLRVLEAIPWQAEMVVLLFPFWAVFVSYIGVRTMFDVKPAPAIFWFAVAPSLFYAVPFAFLIGTLLLLPTIAMTPMPVGPNSYTTSFTSNSFEVQFPDGWYQKTFRKSDRESYVDISTDSPAFARINYYQTKNSRMHTLQQMAEGWTEDGASMTMQAELENWGDHPAIGYHYDAKYGNRDFELRLYAHRPNATHILVVQEFYPDHLEAELVPDFQHIRESFTLKP